MLPDTKGDTGTACFKPMNHVASGGYREMCVSNSMLALQCVHVHFLHYHRNTCNMLLSLNKVNQRIQFCLGEHIDNPLKTCEYIYCISF